MPIVRRPVNCIKWSPVELFGPAEAETDSHVHYLSINQSPDGAWRLNSQGAGSLFRSGLAGSAVRDSVVWPNRLRYPSLSVSSQNSCPSGSVRFRIRMKVHTPSSLDRSFIQNFELLLQTFQQVWGCRCGPGQALRILRLVRKEVCPAVLNFISEGSRCFSRRAHGRSTLRVPSPRASQAALPPSWERNRIAF